MKHVKYHTIHIFLLRFQIQHILKCSFKKFQEKSLRIDSLKNSDGIFTFCKRESKFFPQVEFVPNGKPATTDSMEFDKRAPQYSEITKISER